MSDQSETLKEIQKRLNFANREFMNQIEKVEVFYEDCENCSSKDECPNCSKFGPQGKMLENIHEVLSEEGVESHLHPMTSEDNGELEEIVCEKGGVVPVKTKITQSGPICAPEHNFLLVKTEDGKELLYTVDIDELVDERQGNPMIYR